MTPLWLRSLAVPYGTKGFIVIHKGGDAAVFKEGQATAAGWANSYSVSERSRL